MQQPSSPKGVSEGCYILLTAHKDVSMHTKHKTQHKVYWRRVFLRWKSNSTTADKMLPLDSWAMRLRETSASSSSKPDFNKVLKFVNVFLEGISNELRLTQVGLDENKLNLTILECKNHSESFHH